MRCLKEAMAPAPTFLAYMGPGSTILAAVYTMGLPPVVNYNNHCIHVLYSDDVTNSNKTSTNHDQVI